MPEAQQDFVQTLPPPDEFLCVSMTRPIHISQLEELPLITTPDLQTILVPQQDQAFTESNCDTDYQEVHETPVHPVEPVLGIAPLENHWFENRTQTQDITDILGMTAYEGYV